MSRAHALNQEFAAIVKSERRITREVVRRIAEFEQNYYYAELGFDSIMGWLVEGHGYTKSAAWRRMQAARLVTTVPSALNKIATGEVNLTTLASLQTAIRQEEKRTKSDISKEQKAELVQMIESQSSEKVDRIIAVQFPELDLEKKEFVKPINATETKYTLVFSEGDQKILTRLKEVTSHSHFNASWSELYIVAAKEYLKRHDPLLKTPKKEKENSDREISLSRPRTAARKALSRMDELRETETGRTSAELRANEIENSSSAPAPDFAYTNLSSAPAPSFAYTNSSSAAAPEFTDACSAPALEIQKNSAPLKVKVRHQVLRAANGGCSFVDPATGKRCGSRHLLEVDHIISRADGGTNDISNLRAFCRGHNLLMARKRFGATFLANRRGQSSAPSSAGSASLASTNPYSRSLR